MLSSSTSISIDLIINLTVDNTIWIYHTLSKHQEKTTSYYQATIVTHHFILNGNSTFLFFLVIGFKLVKGVQIAFQWLSIISERKKKRLPANYQTCRKPLFQAFSINFGELDCIKMRFYISVKCRMLVKPFFLA